MLTFNTLCLFYCNWFSHTTLQTVPTVLIFTQIFKLSLDRWYYVIFVTFTSSYLCMYAPNQFNRQFSGESPSMKIRNQPKLRWVRISSKWFSLFIYLFDEKLKSKLLFILICVNVRVSTRYTKLSLLVRWYI